MKVFAVIFLTLKDFFSDVKLESINYQKGYDSYDITINLTTSHNIGYLLNFSIEEDTDLSESVEMELSWDDDRLSDRDIYFFKNVLELKDWANANKVNTEFIPISAK